MRAVVYHGPDLTAWDDVPEPALQAATDAIVRIDAATICGTDLGIVRGDVPAVTAGRILGHEAVGTVQQVGPDVTSLRPGDRVLVSCVTACGSCRYCREHAYGRCLDGGWILGHRIDGTHAESARVPFADTSAHRVPPGVSDEAALMLADLVPTGYEVGARNGRVRTGDVVAVVGTGTVGLAAMMGARLCGAEQVVAVDVSGCGLDTAVRFGADVVVDRTREDPLRVVRELTGGRGADVTIDAVGIHDTFTLATRLARTAGHLATIGVHGVPSNLDLETRWLRDVWLTTGTVDTYSTPALLRHVANGRIDPGRFVTHRFPLDGFLEAYDVFARARDTRALKVVVARDA